MKVLQWDHRLGQRLMKNAPEFQNLISNLNNIPIPICEGFKRPPFDVKQAMLNTMIEYSFNKHGWKSEPYIDTSQNRKSSQKGDFTINTECGLRILVEVEFGYSASAFRDLYKFNLAYSKNTYDCAVFIVPMRELQRRIDVTPTYEKMIEYLTEARDSINLPLVLVGLGFDGKEIDLMTIVDDVDFWKTYRKSDFKEILNEFPQFRFAEL
jgi:hypothetical protein